MRSYDTKMCCISDKYISLHNEMSLYEDAVKNIQYTWKLKHLDSFS
jgi:hypothetical protein